tara:strand:- start:46 stop:759 length:714 start_codon:yes stop_codon:yes gene_type:complete
LIESSQGKKSTGYNLNNKIRSYVIRSGRITVAQNRALDRLLPKYANLTEIHESIEDIKLNGKSVNLEIGLGDGKNLIHLAKKHPSSMFLGCDVHLPGIGSTLNSCELQSIKNVRILVGDINEVLTSFGRIFQNVYIFFPDPWPKKRHHKRRLINKHFLNLISQKIKLDGKIFIATDCYDYAVSILDMIEISESIKNFCGTQSFAKRPSWRILTKFEEKALQTSSKVYEIHCAYKSTD